MRLVRSYTSNFCHDFVSCPHRSTRAHSRIIIIHRPRLRGIIPVASAIHDCESSKVYSSFLLLGVSPKRCLINRGVQDFPQYTQKGLSMLLINKLLCLWNRSRISPSLPVTLFHEDYLYLDCTDTDEFCDWLEAIPHHTQNFCHDFVSCAHRSTRTYSRIIIIHQPRLRRIIPVASTMAVKARKYILRSYFSGFPQRDALKIVEEELPPIKDGGVLSYSPYSRSELHFCFCIWLR